jgi:hypothetical protein
MWALALLIFKRLRLGHEISRSMEPPQTIHYPWMTYSIPLKTMILINIKNSEKCEPVLIMDFN